MGVASQLLPSKDDSIRFRPLSVYDADVSRMNACLHPKICRVIYSLVLAEALSGEPELWDGDVP